MDDTTEKRTTRQSPGYQTRTVLGFSRMDQRSARWKTRIDTIYSECVILHSIWLFLSMEEVETGIPVSAYDFSSHRDYAVHIQSGLV